MDGLLRHAAGMKDEVMMSHQFQRLLDAEEKAGADRNLINLSPPPMVIGSLAAGWEAIGANTFSSVPVDIIVVPNRYSLILDVPGLTKSDIQVLVEESKILVVKAGWKRKWQQDHVEEEEESGEVSYLRYERKPTVKFNRRFCLPRDADVAAIAAKWENEVLTITIGRKATNPPVKPAETKAVPVTIE